MHHPHDPSRDRLGRFAPQAHDRAQVDLEPMSAGEDPEAVESARRVDRGLAGVMSFDRIEMDDDSSAVEVAVIQAAMDRLWSNTPRRSPLDGVLFQGGAHHTA